MLRSPMKLTKLSSCSKFASKKLQKLQTAVFHCIFTIPFTMNSQNFTFAQISINQRGIKISFYNFMIYQKLKNSSWSTTNKVATNWRTVLRMGKTLLRNIIIRFLSMYVYNLWFDQVVCHYMFVECWCTNQCTKLALNAAINNWRYP